METSLVPYRDLEAMAAQVVKSKMFPGITSPEAAMTLFLLCQSEGLHPMQALTRYHVISGRPSMKADAMLAEFMRRGGTVEWSEYTDEKVAAVFTSKGCPSGVTVTWTTADARRAGITNNPTWTKYPRQMLKARVASDGVRMTDPAVNQGRYSPEEHESFQEASEVKPAEIVAPEPPQEAEGPSREEVLLRKSLGETPELGIPPEAPGFYPPEGYTVAPGHCHLKGCGGEIELYVSESKAFPGREYFQCAMAHEEKLRLLNEGATNKLANAAVAAHYREWAGPWPERDRALEAHEADREPSIFQDPAERAEADQKFAAYKKRLKERDEIGTESSKAAAAEGARILASGGEPLAAFEEISKQVAKKIAAEAK